MPMSSRCQPFSSVLGALLGSLLACLAFTRLPAHAQRIRAQPPPGGQLPQPAAQPAPLPPPAAAQAPVSQAPPTPLPAQAQPVEPAPSGPRLSLVQAIHSTLRKHPAIAQAHATMAQREADVVGAHAPFDTVLNSQLGQNRDNTPLLPNERLDPRERSTITDSTDLSLGVASAFQWGMSEIGRAHV